MKKDQTIVIISGTRADWGLLSPVAKALDSHDNVNLVVVATNMHLISEYGYTVDEIKSTGIENIKEILMFPSDCSLSEMDSPVSKVSGMSRLMSGLGCLFEKIMPDKIVILGDRYEMLAAASVAVVMGIPVIHIAGGEISEGAIDDSIRHAITKCSSLHFTATEQYRQRVIQMGEQPESVINSGALGLWNLKTQPHISKEELEESIGFDFGERCALMTFHPVTLDRNDVAAQCRNVFEALVSVDNLKVLVTYPNNDADSLKIIDEINRWVALYPDRIKAVASLGMKRYLSALKYVDFVIGNSSSGLTEVPGAQIPTIDIGIRQRGRTAGPSVIHCDNGVSQIREAILYALSPEGKRRAKDFPNPYYKPDTVDIISRLIIETPREKLIPKKFNDIKIQS